MNRSIRLRLVLTIAAVLALSAALLFLSVRIQQRVIRHRAEDLLSDVRSLELRKSTWTEAEGLFRKWGAWGSYEGTCTPAECSYNVELHDLLTSTAMRHPKIAERSQWLLKLYVAFGGRLVLINANIRIIDGRVWGKNFSAFVSVPPEKRPNARFGGYGYTLMGIASTVSRFSSPPMAEHGEYVIGTPGGCTGCLAVYTKFTPYATQADTERLMDFNLECITRRQPCREKAEIMPAAWNEFEHGSDKREAAWHDLKECRYPIRLLARDTANAVIAKVMANRTEKGAESYQVSRMRLVSPLKGTTFWQTGTEQDVRVFDGSVSGTEHNSPRDILPGTTFILLFTHAKYGGPNRPDVWLDECGCIPATDANLAEVRAGIDRDFESKRNARQENP